MGCFKAMGIGPKLLSTSQVMGTIQVIASSVFTYESYDRNGKSVGVNQNHCPASRGLRLENLVFAVNRDYNLRKI